MYCTRLTGPISHTLWEWAAKRVPTIYIFIYIYITKTKRGIEKGFFGKLSWTVALLAPPYSTYALRELSQVSIVVQAPMVAMLLKQDIQFHNNKSTYQ